MQSHSSSIIKNFFITGLKQDTLRTYVDKPLKQQISIPPEVLFSLYSPQEEMEPYLKFVFPERITIERRVESVVPKFYTFMSTDGDGINAYFHCLIFYEQFSLYDIKKDFDVEATTAAEKQRRQMSARYSTQIQSPISKSTDLTKSARSKEMVQIQPQEECLSNQLRMHCKGNKINASTNFTASQMGKTMEKDSCQL